MTFSTTIQTYDGAHANHNTGMLTCAVKWATSELWMGSSVTGTDYISRYGIISGAEEAFNDTASINSGVSIDCVGWDGSGNVYLSGPNPLTHGGITQIDGSALTFIAYAGYAAPNFGGTNIVSNGGGTAMANTNTGNTIINLNNTSYSDGATTLASYGWPNGNARSCISPGRDGSNVSFLLTSPGNGISTQLSTLQKINAAGTATTVGTYSPSDFDPSWTEAYGRSMCVDQTDGHVICNFSGVGSSVNNYIVKLNSSTGGIEWSTALTTTTGEDFSGGQWAQSRIRHSQLMFIQSTPTATIVVMNTGTGSITSTQTTGLAGVGLFGKQSSDDTLGCIIGLFSANGDPSGPSALNGSTFPFTGWAAIYVTEAINPSITFGSAYMIERMDNRIWPAVENVWCVDCGLSTTLTYPDALLTASSATGAGIPTGITINAGGQGYADNTTAEIIDPTGNGATVSLTIASGIITGASVLGGTGYTYPEITLNDPSGRGVGADLVVTLDTSATFSAGAAVFDVSMVGYALRMGGGRAIITDVIDDMNVVADIVNPITATIPNSGGVPLPAPSGEWSIAPMITTVGGLWHLIGFTVTGTADGEVIPSQVVTPEGTITLGSAASLVTVGLAFTPQFQSLYLDGGNPTVQGQRKKVAAATIRLDASGVDGIVGGTNQPDGAAQNPPVIDMTWNGLVPFELRADEGTPPFGSTTAPLWTGDVRQPIPGGFDRPGQVALQQNSPLPMNVLAIVPEGLEGDTPQQGYEQSPGRPPGRGNRG